MHLFEELDEEAEREDGRQAVAEEIAGAHFLAVAAIEPQAGEEENKIGDGFVKLSRMARYDVAVVGEDEAPGYVSRPADDFGVHEVAQPDKARRDGSGDGNVVQYAHQVHLHPPDVEPKCQDKSERAAVTRQAGVACVAPAVGGAADGEEHLDGVTEEIGWLIEEAVAEPCADKDADEAIEEEGVELFARNALAAVETGYDEVGQHESDSPAERIPAQAEVADVQGDEIGVPDDGFCHGERLKR